VLVVVDVVPRVAVRAVDVVDVVLVADRLVAAPLAMRVHVPGVRQVGVRGRAGLGVHVVVVDPVRMAVVEVVDVVAVLQGRVSAAGSVLVGMRLERLVRIRFGHRYLRPHGSPNATRFASCQKAQRPSPDRRSRVASVSARAWEPRGPVARYRAI
jgi:hypothetical protein